ncbi:phage tail tape measure protein [Clostridium perfringens]|uniref:phage tail tape measure protein n=1 Tax=Clostridium perfringens TaxID=1502 RepID=UPI002340E73C|nr:phage tail tape measure protein [Clostridium perfringens]MDC4245500.1 phage tail tape measure protein [Clostridium perfringens]
MSLNLSFGGKLNKDKVLQQLEKDIKSLSKNLGVELEKVSLKDVDKATNQIQKQINQLSKNINLNISKISLGNNGALQDIQKQINSALKGEKINLEVKSDLKNISGDFEDILKKSKNLENEIQLLNGKMAKLSTVMDKKGNVKNTTLTYQYDEGRQAVEKYGWTVKEVEGELVRVFDLVDKKIVSNKSKLESVNLSQEQFLTQLENRLNKIKTLSETQHLKNENYDNSRDLTSVENIQNRINEIKTKNIKLSKEEKNIMTQQLVELDSYIKKESNKSAEINRSARFLTSQLRTLENLKVRVDNRGGKSNEQIRISNELEKQINLYKQLIAQNEILGSVERNRIQKNVNDLKVQSRELVTTSQFSNIFARMKDYFIGGSIIGASIGALKTSFNTVLELDTDMRDLKKVTDETNETYSRFEEQANKTAIALGSTTDSVIKATTAWSEAGESFKNAELLAQNSTIFENVGDLNSDEANRGLISTMKAFNVNAQNSIGIIDKLNATSNSYAVTTRSLNNSLMRGGSALAVNNNSLSESIAIITAGDEVLQSGGEKMGNAAKSIAMNLAKMKNSATGIKPKLQDLVSEVTRGKVSLVDVNGQMRSTYDILLDLGKVWGTLTNNQKALLGQELAGKYQANAFYAIMQNYEKLKEVKETAENSVGSAAQEQETYINSLEAKISAIRENIKGLVMDSSNVELFKGLISGANAGVSALRFLIEKIGAVNSMVGTLTFTLMSFNTNFRKKAIDKNLFGVGKIEELFINKEYKMNDKIAAQRDFIKELKNTKTVQLGLNKATLSYTAELGKAKGSIIATKIELASLRVMATLTEAALTAGLSIAISAVVEGVVKLIDKLHMSKQELREFNQDIANSFNNNIEDIKKSEGLVDKINNTKIQISNTSDTQKQNELKKQLLDYEKQLADVLPNAATEFDNEGNAIATNTKLIQENINQKKQAAKDEVGDFIEKNKKFKEHVDEYIKDQKRLEENQLKLRQIQDSNKGKKWYERTENTTALEKDIKKAKEEVKDYSAEINNLIKMKKGLESAGVSQSDITNIIGQDNLDALEKYNQHLEQTQTTADNTKPSLEGLTNPLDAIKESATSAADELDKLGSKFNKLTGNIGLVQDAMKEFQKTGTLSAKTVGSMLNSGDTRVISLLADRNKFMENSIALEKTLRTESDATYRQAIQNSQNLLQQGINDLSSKQAIETQAMNHSVGLSNQETQAKMNNYANDTNAHADSESTKVANGQNGAEARTEASSQETNHKAEHYKTDNNNHTNLVTTKSKTAVDGANAIQDANGQMITNMGGAYKTDVKNFDDACKTKALSAFELMQKLNDMMAQAGLGLNSEGLPNQFDPKQPSVPLKPGYQWKKDGVFWSAWSEHSIDPILPSNNPVQVDYSPEANGHGHKGSGSKGNKGKGSKNGEHVDIKDIEDKIDAYKSLQDAIDDVNNELEITKTLEENVQGVNKLQYMNKEINLYKQKKDAINNLIAAKQNEGRYLEGVLKNNGFNVSNGNISNYYDRLKQIEDEVNAMDNSNKAKEEAIKNFKDLKEKADKYFEITSKELPKLNNEWYQLNKTIKEVSERQVKLMGDTEREMTNVVKNQVEERKKALEDETSKIKEELKKQRDEYNKKYDDENFEKNLKEKQDKLNKLNAQIDSVRRDISSEGQSKLKDLLKQKDDLEKELNNFIRDRQKDKGNKAFDEQMDKIDKHKDEKIKEMEKTYTDEKIAELAKGMIQKGFIEIEGHVIKLRDALNDYYKKNGEVFADSSLKMQEFADNIKLVNSLYKDLVAINNNLGVSSFNIRYNSGNNVVQAIPKVASFMAIPQGSKKANININTHLNVGSVNNGTTEDIKSMLDERDRKIINEINEQLNSY